MKKTSVPSGRINEIAYFVLMPVAFAILMWLWTCLWIPVHLPF